MSTNIIFPLRGRRVWVAGHKGMVGSAILRRLERENCKTLTVDHKSVDLADQLKCAIGPRIPSRTPFSLPQPKSGVYTRTTLTRPILFTIISL